MKTGTLVRLRHKLDGLSESTDWTGIIIDWDGSEPIVFWNEQFCAEIEYMSDLEVINEDR